MTTEGLDAALESCCARLLRGDSLEACLADYPAEWRAEVRRLAPLAARISRLGRDPSPEFQARLLEALRAEVRNAPAAASRQRGWYRLWSAFRSPLLRLATVFLVAGTLLAAGGIGVGQAAADSLPDSPLYPVKAAREWLEAAIALNSESRFRVEARQIEERRREIEQALEKGKARPVIEQLARRVLASADRLVEQAIRLREAGNPQAIRRALNQIRRMQDELERVSIEAPPLAREALDRLQRHLRTQEERLMALEASSAPPPRIVPRPAAGHP